MKTTRFLFPILIFGMFLSLTSCRPIIVSARPNLPPPNWFYPDRVVNLRYVYFPEYLIYYDLTMRNYIYLDNGVWITVAVLPSRFSGINFRHARQIRVDNYFDDNIKYYHSTIRVPVKGRRETTPEPNSSRIGRRN